MTPLQRIVETRSGQRIHTESTGSGPTVLMVHGFPETSSSWNHLVPHVAASGFTAVTMDVRGYGRSSKPRAVARYTLLELASDIAEVISAYGDDAVLIGHDWGAMQVYTTARVHPERVRAVVGLSVAAAPFPVDDPVPGWHQAYRDRFFYKEYFQRPGVAEAELEKDTLTFLTVFYTAMAGDRPDQVDILNDVPRRGLLDGLNAPSVLPDWLDPDDLRLNARLFAEHGLTGPLNRYRALSLDVEQLRPYANCTIDQPAEVILGLADPARFSEGKSDRYADPGPLMTRLEGVHLLPGAGHWLQRERPDQVVDMVTAFLRRHP